MWGCFNKNAVSEWLVTNVGRKALSEVRKGEIEEPLAGVGGSIGTTHALLVWLDRNTTKAAFPTSNKTI
jgi:hypothetical protein